MKGLSSSLSQNFNIMLHGQNPFTKFIHRLHYMIGFIFPISAGTTDCNELYTIKTYFLLNFACKAGEFFPMLGFHSYTPFIIKSLGD